MSSGDSNSDRLVSKKDRAQECSVCLLCFRTHVDLMHHKKIHIGVKPYVCGTCDEAFAELSEYKYHLKVHTKDKDFICKYCSMTFPTKSSLLTHEVTHVPAKKLKLKHSSKDSDDLKICEKKIASRKKRRSKANHHCESCGKSFHLKDELHSHLAEHVNKNSHMCSVCEGNFSSAESLLVHKREHFCSQTFLSKLAKLN